MSIIIPTRINQTTLQWSTDATVYPAYKILGETNAFYGATDQPKFKFSDGVQTWAQLNYMPIDLALALTLAQVLANGNVMSSGQWIEGFNNANAYLWFDNGTYFEAYVNGSKVYIDSTNASLNTSLAAIGITDAASVLAKYNLIRSTGNHDLKGIDFNLDFTNVKLSNETASLILATDASKNVKGLATTTYPSLTELAYVKGVTSAIQTQLNLKAFKSMPFYVSATIAVTGTTSETVLAASINLVGVIAAHDYFRFEATVQATNNGNTKYVRWYISDSPSSLLNQVQVGGHSAGTGWGTSPSIVLSRYLKMKSNLAGNIYLDNSVTNLNLNNFYAQTTSPIQLSGTIDFSTGTKYLVLTGQLLNAADTLNIYEAHSYINNPRA